jgi:hypothetical protein
MRIVLLALALAVSAASLALAQSDDPAVLACEERERPQAADAGYKRLSASVDKDRVALTFETSQNGATTRHREECRFALHSDGNWALDGARSPSRVRCEALTGEAKALIDQNRIKEAGALRARMEVCLDVMKRELQRESIRLQLANMPNGKFAYPIPPAATALRAP